MPDIQKLKFMMSVQREIDRKKLELGETNPEVIKLKNRFERLSDGEFGVIHQATIDPLQDDIKKIRHRLEMRGDNSIIYDFVENEKVKKQLMKDNFRMENIRLDDSIKDESERFYNFCVNAFFQIEEIINYFLIIKFMDNEIEIKQFILNSKSHTAKTIEDIKKQKFYQIEFNKKLDAFAQKYLNSDMKSNLHNIKNTRNEEIHRCTIIEKDSERILRKYDELKARKKRDYNYIMTSEDFDIQKYNFLIPFLREKNFNLVRNSLITLVDIIKSDLRHL